MQFNVVLPDNTGKRIKKDAIDLDVSLNAYALQAFERFMSFSKTQRRVYLSDRKHRKVYGRRISA